MTDEELKEYYADLLIIQYANKPKAYDTIKALVSGVIMNQIVTDVQNAFSIDTAVGVQLDIIGKYAGVSRYAYDFNGAVTLNDTDYRILIKMKVVQNNSGSSLADIQFLLNEYFQGAFLVFDYTNMQLSYMFDATYGSNQLAEILVKQKSLPKPMGVQLGALIFIANINNAFGMGSYTVPAYNVVGFNDYSNSVSGTWISYSNAIFT
jgi:hypothetical protein